MIPFPFNENRFSFFVADHLLVGQLCTNPMSDRSFLSCLKVTQCSTSKIGDAPLYKLMLSTDPSYDNRTIASTLKMQIWITTNNRGRAPGWWKQSFRLRLWSLVWFQVRGHIMPTSHLRRSAWKSTPKVYLDVLKSVVIPWCNQVGRWQDPWVWQQDSAPAPQVPKRPRLGFRRSATTLYLLSLAPSTPRPEPAGLFRFGHTSRTITNMTSPQH